MKKVFPPILVIGMLLLLVWFFQSTERASGADRGVSVGVAEQNKIQVDNTPWIEPPNWNYRRPVIIHSNTSLPWYQVLIHLHSGNFEFNLAKPDGSDVRFTLSDGMTPLFYWIESWNSVTQSAYIWVKVAPISNGDTTIYLYYDNPAETSLSNGSLTFDSFDDNWSQYASGAIKNIGNVQKDQSSEGIEGLFNWITLSGTPSASSGLLTINSGTGIRSTSSNYLYQAVGFRANFGSGNGNEWGGFSDGNSLSRTTIGDLPGKYGLYLINNLGDVSPQIGSTDWHNAFHTYELRWKYGQSMADVDHGAANITNTASVPSTSLPVTFYSYTGSGASLQVDWVYVRQYHDPEPVASVGANQGLVDLAVDIVDSPDPSNTSKELTYLLTVSNHSGIDAPGAVVTDTLDGSVSFITASAPLGCIHVGINVVCNLSIIGANSSANATIKVKPNTDGIIPNSAEAGSPGFDPNPSDNYDQVTTLVDSIPPTVEWLKPVANRETYFTEGGPVDLQVTAEDNNLVDRVEFWRYYSDEWHFIEAVYTAPYQIQFNSDVLIPNQPWPFEVFAYDKAGNKSATTPNDIRQVIYIERIYTYFLFLPRIAR